MPQRAYEADPDVEVNDAAEERGSHTRMRSVRREALQLDEHERPTLVPAEPVDAAALEARVLFESRAVMERRYAAATQQDLQATRRIDAVVLEDELEDEPLRITVDHSVLDEAFDRRRARVRGVALSLMLAFVVAIALVVFRR